MDKYTRPPHYIHDLVEIAGRENIFWTSARRPGNRPDYGDGASELSNAVVGSTVTATQGTPSNQPIWQGSSYGFAGDDYLDLSGHVTDLSGGITLAFALESDSGTGDRYIFGGRRGDGSLRPRVGLLVRDNSDYFAVFQDSDSQGGFAGVSITTTEPQIVVVRGAVESGDLVTRLWVDGSSAASTPEAQTGTLDILQQRIGAVVGASGSAGLHWSGDLSSALVVGEALSDTLIESTLIPGMRQSWRIG